MVAHCRHCLGDCPGDCLVPGQPGVCIHDPDPRLPLRRRLVLLRTGTFWRRLFWGP
jgi:hypothetical protein